MGEKRRGTVDEDACLGLLRDQPLVLGVPAGHLPRREFMLTFAQV
jgi:hypothetical protein